MIALGWPNQNAAFGRFFTTLHTPDASEEQFRSYDELLRLTTTPDNAVKLVRTFGTMDLRATAPLVRCAALYGDPCVDLLLIYFLYTEKFPLSS